LLDELLIFEETAREPDPTSDVREVANYVRALEYGFARPPERPISLGFIKEMHYLLMEGVRGGDRRPGELRVIQNFIGRPGDRIATARFVPPPPTELSGRLEELERAMNEPSELPPLVRVAYVHYQCEAIHPFIDGNGRLGRLLIPLLLSGWGFMEHPILYLSDYFEQYPAGYRDGLFEVSRRGDCAGWLAYFLDAVTVQSHAYLARAEALLDLRQRYRAELLASQRPVRMLQLVDDLFERPTITIKRAAERLGVVATTATGLIQRLVDRGILVEVTGQRRGRVYLATEIVGILQVSFAVPA
jgi:Fic family protein